jgi:hypothetical protein
LFSDKHGRYQSKGASLASAQKKLCYHACASLLFAGNKLARVWGKGFSLNPFDLICTNKELKSIATHSGLIGENFPEAAFMSSNSLRKNTIKSKNPGSVERLAQVVPDYLRKKCLRREKNFLLDYFHSRKIRKEQ